MSLAKAMKNEGLGGHNRWGIAKRRAYREDQNRADGLEKSVLDVEDLDYANIQALMLGATLTAG